MIKKSQKNYLPSFLELKKNLKKDFSSLLKIKLAILGDHSTHLFSQSLKGYGYKVGYNLNIFEANYQIHNQALNSSSDMYRFNPDFIIIFETSIKLLDFFYSQNQKNRSNFSNIYLTELKKIINKIFSNSKARIIFSNFSEIDDKIYGNYANKLKHSFLYQIRKINLELMRLANKKKALFINDISSLSHYYGLRSLINERNYITADFVFDLEYLPAISKNVMDIILACIGRIKKCLIIDLDNTIWGGTIGDKGIEKIEIGNFGVGKAYSRIQTWIKELKNRGIILAVCSKNSLNTAKKPFTKQREMILKLDDFAVFVANWKDKLTNVRYIQSILNIGFDSMVFIDDSPFERNLINTYLPDVNTPDLPEDPAEYLNFLKNLNLFETAVLSPIDESRTKQYQEEGKRDQFKDKSSSIDGYLKKLNIKATIEKFSKFNLPRISQLIQRTNQFNVRTIRYNENELKRIISSKKFITISVVLEDRFGNYGLVGLAILKKKTNTLFIDTWIISCRALKRGVEEYMMNCFVRVAKKYGYDKIIGEYIPTPKNSIIKNLYKEYGFSYVNGYWILKTNKFYMLNTYVTEKKT